MCQDCGNPATNYVEYGDLPEEACHLCDACTAVLWRDTQTLLVLRLEPTQ